MGPVSRHGPAPVLAAVAVTCLLLLTPIGHATASQEAQPRGPEDVKLVTVDPDSPDRLWPYTSRERRFETLTLPINVVVLGNDTRIRWFLQTGRNVNWNETVGEWQGVSGESTGEMTGSYDWYDAHGATRYTYIHSSRDPYGGWVDEAYQLHDGDYFGTRYHIRAYTGGRVNTSWTAIQAHQEYWDWFRLRHTVSSTANAQRHVEQSFYGTSAVERVGRERFANGGLADADGWVTVAVMRQPTPPEPGDAGTGTGTGPATGPGTGPGTKVMAGAERATETETGTETETPAGTGTESPGENATGSVPSPPVRGLVVALVTGTVLSVGAADVRRRLAEVENPGRLVALGAVSLLTMPSLRWASITAERTLPWVSPKVVAGLGYLLLAIGLPVAVALLARETRADRAASLAAVGFGTGTFLDYLLVELSVLPLSVVVHRLAVVLALGLVAAAGARLGAERPGHLELPVVAALLWVGVLLWPLLDVLL